MEIEKQSSLKISPEKAKVAAENLFERAIANLSTNKGLKNSLIQRYTEGHLESTHIAFEHNRKMFDVDLVRNYWTDFLEVGCTENGREDRIRIKLLYNDYSEDKRIIGGMTRGDIEDFTVSFRRRLGTKENKPETYVNNQPAFSMAGQIIGLLA